MGTEEPLQSYEEIWDESGGKHHQGLGQPWSRARSVKIQIQWSCGRSKASIQQGLGALSPHTTGLDIPSSRQFLVWANPEPGPGCSCRASLERKGAQKMPV